MHRSSSSFALVVLAACQSTAVDLESRAEWRSQVERSQADLSLELQSIRSLLAERVMDFEAIALTAERSAAPSVSGIEFTAALAALSGRIDMLTATMATASAARSAGAVHASAASMTGEAASTAGLEPLKQALLVLERRRALHCENIANAGMPGYKRRTLLLAAGVDEPSGLRSPGAAGVALLMTEGALEVTRASLDLGIEGKGFFRVMLPDGEFRYSRAGTFRLDFNGHLVTAEGYRLADQVRIPESSLGISISHDGKVFSIGEGHVQEHVGTIRLHVFPNATGLEPVSSKYFAPTEASGPAKARQPGVAGAGRLLQGYIERSNVEITDELIDLQLIDRQARAVRHALASHGIYTGS